MTLRSPAQDEVERVLLAHPDVMDVALVDEEGFEGHRFTVAYVVPDPERMKAAKSRIFIADRDRRIVQWRRAFDQTYRRGPDNNAPTFVGWTSNFTNKTIPESEMREWLNCTAERIAALGPGGFWRSAAASVSWLKGWRRGALPIAGRTSRR